MKKIILIFVLLLAAMASYGQFSPAKKVYGSMDIYNNLWVNDSVWLNYVDSCAEYYMLVTKAGIIDTVDVYVSGDTLYVNNLNVDTLIVGTITVDTLNINYGAFDTLVGTYIDVSVLHADSVYVDSLTMLALIPLGTSDSILIIDNDTVMWKLEADLVPDSAGVSAYADSAYVSYHADLADSATNAVYSDSSNLSYHSWITHFSDSATNAVHADSADVSAQAWLADSSVVSAYADSAYLAYHSWVSHFSDSSTNAVHADSADVSATSWLADSSIVSAYSDSAYVSYHSDISDSATNCVHCDSSDVSATSWLADSATNAVHADSSDVSATSWLADSATNCVYCDTAIYALSAGGSGGASYWDSTTNVIHLNDSLNNVALGISTTNKEEKLRVYNGSVLFDGTAGNTPDTLAGPKMMWIPFKKAFRVGDWTYPTWLLKANIGVSSIAMMSAKASGQQSFAVGTYQTSASGLNSVALGAVTTASGDNSFATTGGVASNYYSSAIGNANSTGYWTFATNYSTTAQAYQSSAFGRFNVVTGTTTSWVSTEPLFVIGNGTGTGANSNDAFRVLKNGTTYIGDASSTTDPIMTIQTTDSIVLINGIYHDIRKANLDSLQKYVPATGVSGRGWISVDDGSTTAEWADFFYADDGTVTLIQNSANVVNTDTDGKVCIIDDGSGIAILNRLAGAAKGYKIRLEY